MHINYTACTDTDKLTINRLTIKVFLLCCGQKQVGQPLERPQADFFYIYGWFIKIYDCFSAKPEKYDEGIFQLKFSAVYKIYG